MDVRHQVFVSSTYVDLVEERREVIQALLELDCVPAGMEMFPAANEEQWELIRSVIDQSDYYIVIVGGRYGSVTSEGVSYTEMEYDYAIEQGIPIAGFVHADPGQIPASKSEIDAAALKKLEAFRDKVKTRMVKTFTDPASLGAVVSRSLVALMRKHPRPGWVRGEHAMTDATRAEISDLKAKLAEVEKTAALDAAHAETSDPSLAQGSDTVVLSFVLSLRSWTENGAWEGSHAATWDQILGAIGPMMLDEAVDYELRARLQDWLLTQLEDLPRHRTELAASISKDDWDSVIIQLRALGLIEMSSKKRSVKDTATYWRLTVAGDRRLVQIRAARKDAQPE